MLLRKIKHKKAELVTDETGEFVLGAAGAILILFLIALLVRPYFDKCGKTAENLLENFNEAVDKAEGGKVGEFLIWENPKDCEMFLVYFNGKNAVDYYGDAFVILESNNVGDVCVCYIKSSDYICDDCISLAREIVFEGMGENWIISNDVAIEILKNESKYVIKEKFEGFGGGSPQAEGYDSTGSLDEE